MDRILWRESSWIADSLADWVVGWLTCPGLGWAGQGCLLGSSHRILVFIVNWHYCNLHSAPCWSNWPPPAHVSAPSHSPSPAPSPARAPTPASGLFASFWRSCGTRVCFMALWQQLIAIALLQCGNVYRYPMHFTTLFTGQLSSAAANWNLLQLPL